MVLKPGYPFTTDNFRNVVKMTVLIKKKPGMSDQDFVRHYNNVHAQMAAPVVEKHKAISYTLTYHLERDRTIIQDILRGNATLLDYDAICTFVFPDWMALARFMYDPDSKALRGDHDNFMVEGEMKFMVGDEYVLIEDGKRVN